MSFRKFIAESQLLLEYDEEKTWKQHGQKVQFAALMAHNNGDTHPAIKKAFEGMPHASGSFTPEYQSRVREHMMKHFEETDPTPNKKYVQHIARIYGHSAIAGDPMRTEDLQHRMKPALAKFHDLVTRKVMPAEHRDIGKLKSLGEIEDLNDAHGEQLSGKESDKLEHEKMKGQATITDHPDFTHIIPHTQAAATHFGRGTRWCTTSDAADEYGQHDTLFDHYNEEGPLHILIPKNPRYAGEKYQYHHSSNQFMNEKDEPVYHGDPPGGQPPESIRKWRTDYDDSLHDAAKTPDAMQHREASVRTEYLKKHASADHINELLKTGDAPTFNAMTHNENFPKADAVKTVLDHNKDTNTRVAAITSAEEKPGDITRVLSDHNEDPDVAKGAVVSLHADSDHMFMALKHPEASVRMHAMRAGLAIGPEHRKWGAENGDATMRRQVAASEHTDEDTLHKLAHDKDWNVAWNVQANKNATDKVREAALTYPHAINNDDIKDGDPYAQHPLMSAIDNIHNHSDAEQLKMKILDHPSSDARYSMLQNRWASPGVLYKALDDKNTSVQHAAASNPGATSGVIDKALEKGLHGAVLSRYNPPLEDHHIDKIVDEAPHQWHRLVGSSDSGMTLAHKDTINKLQPHHIDKMLDAGVHRSWDNEGKVLPPIFDGGSARDVHTHTHLIMHSKNASSANIDKALEHPEEKVRRVAAMREDLAPHHIEKAIRDKSRAVATTVSGHENITSHAISMGLQHPDHTVRHTVYVNNKERFGPEHKELVDAHIKDWNDGYGTIHGKISESRSFKNFITESTLLLEYDAKKTWANHGEKALNHFKANEENLDHPVAGEILDHIRHKDDKKAGKTLLKHFEETDPTPNKKYVQHITRIYGNSGVNRFEDLHSRMKTALETFHDLVHRKVMPAEHRDIGRLKTLDSIEDLVDAHSESKSGKEQSAVEHNEMKGQATIKDHEHFTQITPHTSAAANHFGKGTRWCTTGSNGAHMFNHYNSGGPLHILIPKKPSYAGEKYQYHFNSGQFMNEKDSPAADRGQFDQAMSRSAIGNPKSQTHPHIAHFVNEYEAEAQRSIYTRVGLSHQEPKVANMALSHAKDITHDDLTIAMKGGAAAEAIKHPLVHQGHVDQAFEHTSGDVMANAIDRHPDMISKDQITRAMSMGDKAALAGIKHPLVDKDHITQALAKGGEAGKIAVQNPTLSREHLTTALNSEDVGIRKSVLKNSALTSDDLHAAVKKDSQTAIAALSHPKITSDHVASAMNHSDAGVKVTALNHAACTDEIKNNALNSKNPKTRAFMVRNGGDGMAEKGIKDDHELVRWAAVYAKDGEKVIHQAVHDIHPDVRLAAVMHPNAPREVLDKGAFDNDGMVNAAARGHKRAIHRGEHALIAPKYPGRNDGNEKTNANYTHVPDHPLSDLKVDAIRKYVKNHNKTSPSKVRVSQKGRAGVGNPWNKTDEGRRKMRDGSIPLKHASRVDVYISKNDHYSKGKIDVPAHIHAFHPMMEHSAIFDVICNKAQESGIDVSVLCEVFDRGITDWTEQSNKTIDQYAFNRLNSFISGGYARKLDEDLLVEVSLKTLNNYSRKAQLVVDNTPEDSKMHKKSKKGLERAARLSFKKTVKEEQIDEMSPALAQKYVAKASDSVKKLEGGEYTNEKDNKAFKRKMYISFAKHSKLKEDETNVVDNSGTELIERTNLVSQEPAKYATVKRRDAKSVKVRSHHTEKEKGMFDHHRTETALARNFVKRGKDNHLVNKQNRHQLTDRWRDVNRKRIAKLKGTLREGTDYIEARQKLHDAHAEASRQHAGMERDPELRRLDLHRAKKHSIASRVLEILKARAKKPK